MHIIRPPNVLFIEIVLLFKDKKMIQKKYDMNHLIVIQVDAYSHFYVVIHFNGFSFLKATKAPRFTNDVEHFILLEYNS